jgi:26S proteasome regulatory subunit N13
MFQPPAPRPAGHVHVEFRAGLMDWDTRTKIVTADKRKGKVVLFTSEEEQLTHFQWWDRDKNQVVTDLIVINDAYLEKIEKCTTGRVYILRFTSSEKKMFFWMQEPKTEGDDELIKKFNEAIGATIPTKTAKSTTGAATTAPVPTAAAPAVDPELRNILAQFLQGNAAAAARTPPIPMTAVLTTEVLQSLLTDDAAVAEMVTLLPESHKSPESLREVLASPQLQQSLAALSQAVHSDQLPLLLTSLGLNPGVLTSAQPGSDALEVLCKAMEDHFKSGSS